MLSVRREFSEAEQALVIFLRFGSMTTDEKHWMKPAEVFKKTGIKIQSQQNIFRRWKNRGFVIVKDHGNRGGKERLTSEQVAMATSISTLETQAHLSLEDRASILRDRFDIA